MTQFGRSSVTKPNVKQALHVIWHICQRRNLDGEICDVMVHLPLCSLISQCAPCLLPVRLLVLKKAQQRFYHRCLSEPAETGRSSQLPEFSQITSRSQTSFHAYAKMKLLTVSSNLLLHKLDMCSWKPARAGLGGETSNS